MNPSPYEPPLHPSELKQRTTKVRSFVGFIISCFIGVGATLAWQTYGVLARETIANWSPRLAWLAPPAAPTGPDQVAALSRDLAVVRQGFDKLAADITKLQAPQQGTDKTSAPPRSAAAAAAVAPARKPGSQTR